MYTDAQKLSVVLIYLNYLIYIRSIRILKEETKNRIRRIFGMQQYCPECGFEIPTGHYPHTDRMMQERGGIRCGACGGVYIKTE